MRVHHIVWRIAVLVLLAGTAVAQQGTIRITTNLIQVNVVVRDKTGPIAGLKASDFTVLDDKKPQKIALFTALDGRNEHEKVLPAASRIVSNRLNSAGEAPASVTILLFDIMNTPMDDQPYAIKQLVAYLRTIRPEDRIGLYLLSDRFDVIQDFADSGILATVAQRIKMKDQAGIEIRIVDDLADLLSFSDLNVAHPPIRPKATWVNAMSMMNGVYTNQARATADAMEAIARHLKGLPGRKNLVWLSSGFPFTPPTPTRTPGDAKRGLETPDNFSAELDRASRALNDANVALYPVRVDTLAQNTGFPQVMWRLADATGGGGSYVPRDLQDAVHTAVSDGEVTYTIGFYSTADPADRRLHSIDVKVDRKNVEVRHRAGYYPADIRVPTPQERENQFGLLAGSQLNASQLGLMASADPDPGIPGNYRVTIVADAHDIQFQQENDKHVAKLVLATRLESSKEKNIKQAVIPFSLTEAQYQDLLKGGIPLRSTLPGTAGDRLRIVLQDQSTGYLGAVWLPLAAARKE